MRFPDLCQSSHAHNYRELISIENRDITILVWPINNFNLLLFCIFSEMTFFSFGNIDIYLFDNESQTTSLLYGNIRYGNGLMVVSKEIFPCCHCSMPLEPLSKPTRNILCTLCSSLSLCVRHYSPLLFFTHLIQFNKLFYKLFNAQGHCIPPILSPFFKMHCLSE